MQKLHLLPRVLQDMPRVLVNELLVWIYFSTDIFNQLRQRSNASIRNALHTVQESWWGYLVAIEIAQEAQQKLSRVAIIRGRMRDDGFPRLSPLKAIWEEAFSQQNGKGHYFIILGDWFFNRLIIGVLGPFDVSLLVIFQYDSRNMQLSIQRFIKVIKYILSTDTTCSQALIV